jgi:cysteine desulfurase
VAALDVDLLSLAAHKFEGPKGVGALYVRHGTNILAQQQGGAQERYRRAGTEDVAGAAGLAAALELAGVDRADVGSRVVALRDALAVRLLGIDGVQETGHPVERLANSLSIVVAGLDGASLVMALDLAGLACSTGSACVTGSTEVSHVLTAMGYPDDEAKGALRLSLGRTTTAEEVADAGRLIAEAIATQREASGRLVAANSIAVSAQGAAPAVSEATAG